MSDSFTNLINEAFSSDGAPLSRELYEELIGVLRNLAKQHLRGVAFSLEESDLLQELLRKLTTENTNDFQSKGRFFAYVNVVMQNLIRDWTRAERAQKRGGEAPIISLTALPELAALPRQELDSAIRELLDTLDELKELLPHAHQVVELKFYYGYTQSQIASYLNLSLSEVKNRTNSAFSFIRRRLRTVINKPSN